MTEDEALLVQQRARDAEALLGNTTFMETVKRLSERITADWRRTSTSAPTLQLQLHAQVAGLDAVVMLLAQDVEEAKYLAAKEAKADKARALQRR